MTSLARSDATVSVVGKTQEVQKNGKLGVRTFSKYVHICLDLLDPRKSINLEIGSEKPARQYTVLRRPGVS
jgi:hypothetical protein